MFYQASDFRNSLSNINLYLQHQKLNKVLRTERYSPFLVSTVLLSVLHLNLQAEKSSHVYKSESQVLHRITFTVAGFLSVKLKFAIHYQSKDEDCLKTIVRLSFANYIIDLWKCNKSVLIKHLLSDWDFFLSPICMLWQLVFIVNCLIWVDDQRKKSSYSCSCPSRENCFFCLKRYAGNFVLVKWGETTQLYVLWFNLKTSETATVFSTYCQLAAVLSSLSNALLADDERILYNL